MEKSKVEYLFQFMNQGEYVVIIRVVKKTYYDIFKMMMQLLWLIFIYFLTGLTVNLKPKLPSQKRNHRFNSIKSLVVSFLIGLGGVMTADWLSDGNPLWPALGLVSGVTGALFPLLGQSEQSFKTGLAVYCGGVFYLKPVIALTGLSIALEGLILSKDRILTVFLFSSILPVLFNFSQINPFFFWAAVIIQLIFLLELKNEIRLRISEFFKSKKKSMDWIKYNKPRKDQD